jgi:hypothetical protein
VFRTSSSVLLLFFWVFFPSPSHKAYLVNWMQSLLAAVHTSNGTQNDTVEGKTRVKRDWLPARIRTRPCPGNQDETQMSTRPGPKRTMGCCNRFAGMATPRPIILARIKQFSYHLQLVSPSQSKTCLKATNVLRPACCTSFLLLVFSAYQSLCSKGSFRILGQETRFADVVTRASHLSQPQHCNGESNVLEKKKRRL